MKRFVEGLRFYIASIVLTVLYIPGIVMALDSLADPVEDIDDHVVILQLQTGSVNNASSEYVLLYNPTENDVEVTDWCLMYVSSSGLTMREMACMTAQDSTTELWVDAGGLISFATSQFISENPNFVADFAISSGMNGSKGHVYIANSDAVEIDRVGWGDAVQPETTATLPHEDGEVLSRQLDQSKIDTDDNSIDFVSSLIMQMIESGIYEQTVVIDLCANIDGMQETLPIGYMSNEISECYEDFCPDIDGLQIVAPEGYEKLAGSDVCTLIPLTDATILITELLPNAPSVDTGQEFIELYNPGSVAVDLQGYTVQIGPSFTKEYVLDSKILQPGVYVIYSDTESGITLPNTNGVVLRLYTPAGNLVSETGVYSNAGDDVSWAVVEDQWIYTNQITPAAANRPYLEPAVDEVLGLTTVLAPCPAGKFRNPATNRCKTIETAVSQLVPCDDDEFRNPQTNRCNKITSNSSLAPCDEGEERNPDTNRCRKITGLVDTSNDGLPLISDIPVDVTPGSVNWPVIMGAVLATVGYMVYEWRIELVHGYGRLRRRIVQ